MHATSKPLCTSCGNAEATVYYGADERLCNNCYHEPPKEITVYGAIGAKVWWWNSSAGGKEVVYVRKDLTERKSQVEMGCEEVPNPCSCNCMPCHAARMRDEPSPPAILGAPSADDIEDEYRQSRDAAVQTAERARIVARLRARAHALLDDKLMSHPSCRRDELLAAIIEIERGQR